MKIGVSSCLFGNMCRYDGLNSKDDFIVDTLSKDFTIVSFCPEDDIFGTPRETISLKEFQNEIKVYTNETKNDVTNILQKSINSIIVKMKDENLCGFILKSKSPSCGIYNVKVYDGLTDSYERKGVGLFTKTIKEMYPNLPIEDEQNLSTKVQRKDFINKLLEYHKSTN